MLKDLTPFFSLIFAWRHPVTFHDASENARSNQIARDLFSSNLKDWLMARPRN